MQPYLNPSGDAGILAYEIHEEAIVIEFRNGHAYLYNYDQPGKQDVERMKQLALSGDGLTTYINQHVRNRYAARLR